MAISNKYVSTLI